MNKSQAKKKVFDYFKENAIEYKFVNEELKLIDVDSLDTIYLCASIPEVIGGHIETCIRFREEHLYCQSYYCQPVVHNEEEAIRATRLINYLNRHLKYDCDKLYKMCHVQSYLCEMIFMICSWKIFQFRRRQFIIAGRTLA